MADWAQLTLIHVLFGYEVNVLGLVRFVTGTDLTQLLLILAFLLYTVVAIIEILVKLGVITMDKTLTVVSIAFLIAAGLKFNRN